MEREKSINLDQIVFVIVESHVPPGPPQMPIFQILKENKEEKNLLPPWPKNIDYHIVEWYFKNQTFSLHMWKKLMSFNVT